MYENEVWKDIPHYEGLYQVSSWGRVRRYERVVLMPNGGYKIINEGLVSQIINNQGYVRVSLTNINGKRKTESVHRLVALAFIPNPEGKEEVNHKNLIRSDNRVENLEWMTRQENCHYKAECGNNKKLIQCVETQEIFTLENEKDNKRKNDMIRRSARSKGKYSAYGLHYKYIDKQ